MTNKSVGEVVSPCGWEVDWCGVRYGFVGGGRVGFSPTVKLSDGVVEREWGGQFAFGSAAVSCDGVDKHVLMVVNNV